MAGGAVSGPDGGSGGAEGDGRPGGFDGAGRRGLVVVSNRGPLTFRMGPGDRPERAGSGGGLASALHPLLAGTGATWVSAAMSEADRAATEQGLMVEDGMELVTLCLDRDQYTKAYDVVSNGTLWFAHHHLFDLPRRPRFDRRWHEAWAAYRQVNRAFADAAAGVAPPGATVLVQDYHLSLTGAMLAGDRPDLRTVHFSHTPFAEPGVLRALPTAAARELLAGMAGFGRCGFHTARWERAFRACFDDPELAGPTASAPATFVAPLGPDVAAFRAEAANRQNGPADRDLATAAGDRSVILRVDRIELSKNIIRGFLAFEELLQTHPEWVGRVVFVALTYPSREGLADYLAYRSEVEHTAVRINERWGTGDWTPVLLTVADDRSRSMAAFGRYDVLLVNPVRDGLNLVAKEGPLVNTRHGTLVLSREAGAWEELADVALGVNPFDLRETADALHTALGLDPAERARRSASLVAAVEARTAADWLADQLAAAGPDRGGDGDGDGDMAVSGVSPA